MASEELKRRINLATGERAMSIDGYPRTEEEEERLNGLCRAVLTGQTGEQLMAYLRSITINTVLPTTATDAQLRDLEGQRRIVGILDVRRNARPKETGK